MSAEPRLHRLVFKCVYACPSEGFETPDALLEHWRFCEHAGEVADAFFSGEEVL